MKNKLFILGVILMFFVKISLTSCSNEEDAYYYYAQPELKAEITDGIEKCDIDEQKVFELLYDQVIGMCNSERMGIISNPFIYLEEPEYKAFLDFFQYSESNNIYYLLIDKYLLCAHGVFPYMFADIIDAKYPGIVNEAQEKTSHYSSTQEGAWQIFPSICTEMLIERLKAENK